MDGSSFWPTGRVARPVQRHIALLLLLCTLLGSLRAQDPTGAPQVSQEPADVPVQERPPIELPVIVDVTFEGLKSYSKEKVIERLGIRLGERLERELDVRGVKNAFGLIVLTVQRVQVEGGTRLDILVTELPVDIEPRFLGNESYDEEKLREWAGIGDRQQIWVYEADGVRAKLEEGYRRQGFHFVEVEWVPGPTQPDSAATDIILASGRWTGREPRTIPRKTRITRCGGRVASTGRPSSRPRPSWPMRAGGS